MAHSLGIDDLCQQCGLYQKGARCPNMAPYGPVQAELYLLGMAPGQTEDDKGIPFVGKAGRFLKKVVNNCGGDFNSTRRYNAANCLPPGNKLDSRSVEICSQRVRDDINRVKPKCIVAFGSWAIQALWPSLKGEAMLNIRGAEIPYKLDDGSYTTVLISYHPSYIIRGVSREVEQVFWDDIQRAVLLSQDEEDLVNVLAQEGLFDEPEEVVVCGRWSQVKELFQKIKQATAVAWDYETTQLRPWKLKYLEQEVPPALFSVAFALQGDPKAYVIPLWNHWPEEYLGYIYEGIADWLTRTCHEQEKIAHNLKFELLWSIVHCIKRTWPDTHMNKITFSGKFEDTMLVAWLMDERPTRSKLKYAGWTYLGHPSWEDIDVTKIVKQPRKKALRYNGFDAFYTLKLWEYQQRTVLTDEVAAKIYEEVTKPAQFQFLRTELRGTLVDIKQKQQYQKQFKEHIQELELQIREEAGLPNLNPGSPQQLAKYFVDECGYELIKKGAKGWSVDETTLKHLVDRYNDEVARLVLLYRSDVKLDSTYVSGLDKNIFIDGCLHGSYNLAGPVTGRTSSSDPNMQNFPKRRHSHIRKVIVPPPGYVMVSFDYGQIEARLFAIESGDPRYCKELHNDLDIHLENAIEIFGKKDAKEHRNPVKNGTFAMFYGGGDEKVAATMEAPIEKVAALRALIYEKYPYILDWRDRVVKFERKYGYIESLFGRRRRSPMSYTELVNHQNQSTASDMTLVAMNHLGVAYDVGLMIHDDLTFMLPDDDTLPDKLVYIGQAMLAIPWWYIHESPWMEAWVPLQVECAVGNNWGQLDEVYKITSLDAGMNSLEDSLDYAEGVFKELGTIDHQWWLNSNVFNKVA